MSIVDKLIQKLDSDKVFKFSSVNPFSEESSWLPTGSPSLDLNLKTLGLPTGIIEIRGDSQAGKTTFTLMLIKASQEMYGDNLIVVILSSERRDNKPYAEQLGLDTEKIPIIRVKFLEDVFNKIAQVVGDVNSMVREKEVEMEGKPRFLFIWDSLGQTISKQEKEAMNKRSDVRGEPKTKEAQENETKSAAMGSAARALSIGLRSIMALTDEADLSLVIINRAYDNIGGVGKSSYGGQAITFYPNMRIELARKEGIKVSDEEIGQITLVKTIKTDFDKPKQQFKVEIGYGLGYILSEEDFALGVEAGILEKNGQNGYKFMKGKLTWATRRQLYKLYEEHNPLLKILIKKLQKIAHEKVMSMKAE